MQQPAGTFSPAGHAKRVAPVFLTPAMAWAIFSAADWLRGLADRRADAQMKKLKDKLRKILADLKDSTRYQRTQALLQKYDPDLPPTPPPGAIKANGPKNKKGSAAGRGKPGSGGATGVVGTAAASAGVALSSALGQMFSTAAEKLIADDPQVVAMLRDAQRRAQALEEENEYLRHQLGMAVASGGMVVRTAEDVPFGDHGAFGSPVPADEDKGAAVDEEEDTPGGVEDLGERIEAAAAGGEESAEREEQKGRKGRVKKSALRE